MTRGLLAFIGTAASLVIGGCIITFEGEIALPSVLTVRAGKDYDEMSQSPRSSTQMVDGAKSPCGFPLETSGSLPK